VEVPVSVKEITLPSLHVSGPLALIISKGSASESLLLDLIVKVGAFAVSVYPCSNLICTVTPVLIANPSITAVLFCPVSLQTAYNVEPIL